MRKIYVLLFVAILFSLFLVSAKDTCLTINSKDTASYLNELTSINSQLSSCQIIIPSAANFIIKNGNVLVSIKMDSGITERFYITIADQKVSSFTSGEPTVYSHEITLSEKTMDKILNSDNGLNEILAGISNKDIVIRPNSFTGKIKWFFAKFFLPKPSVSNPPNITGKPENCDETYLQGHREYADNKELWDSFSADSDKVCQSQYGRGAPSPCIHTVQLSIEGNPYYLCWYNE